MRSSFVFRFTGALVITAALLVGAVLPVAAQEVTPEAPDGVLSEMMRSNSSCPQNVVPTLVAQLLMLPMDGTGGTEEAPMVDPAATEESMAMTAEPTLGPLCLIGSFTGAAEAPGPGDEDGLGLAFVTFDSMTGEVCYEIAVANIELPAQAMHIHMAAAGQPGGVVIPFPTAPDVDGMASGCTFVEDLTVVEDLAANPEGYYVNVHTTDFPDGAVRAQLMTFDEAGQQLLEGLGLQVFDMRGDTADMLPEMTPETTPGS